MALTLPFTMIMTAGAGYAADRGVGDWMVVPLAASAFGFTVAGPFVEAEPLLVNLVALPVHLATMKWGWARWPVRAIYGMVGLAHVVVWIDGLVFWIAFGVLSQIS